MRKDLKMKTKRFIRLTFLIILLIAFFTGCNKEEMFTARKDGADITVHTTLYPIQFIVEEIGAEFVDVTSVYPPGVDAHTYEPTTKDMTDIATSDAFIYFGPSMEGFVQSAADALEGESVELISLEDYDEVFDTPQLEEPTSEEGQIESDSTERNPHVWIDPLRMMAMTEIIAEQLIAISPKHEDVFERNKLALLVKFQKLEDLFQEKIASNETKYMIVPHAAYDYWEERYGIEQIAISGLSPSEEPSQKYLTEIMETADAYGIDYLFYEQNTPDRLIEIMKDELNAEAYTIHNLAVLTEEDIENKEDYITLMEGNIEVLEEVFQ